MLNTVISTIAMALLVGACAAEPAPATALPSDAHFVRPDVAQCLATHPDPPGRYTCCQLLWLGADGVASVASGEESFPGRYSLDGHVATGTIFGEAFTFDLETNAGTGVRVDGAWMPDTAGWDTRVCE